MSRTFMDFDPRTKDWLLMGSWVPVGLICFFYIAFVCWIGPYFMKNRKPYELRSSLIVYNALQTMFSLWIFIESCKQLHQFGGMGCKPVIFTEVDDTTMWVLRLWHFYFLSKISELADTVFFVLRKKNNQISFLHVFHHTIMVPAVWWGLKIQGGGNFSFVGIPNVFVHIWMYLYYMVAAMGPQYQKYIWWKRYLTQMQLVQFFLIIAYVLYVFYKCNVSKALFYLTVTVTASFIVLFADFYRKEYIRRAKKVAVDAENRLQEKPSTKQD